jgi:hypothetical protein
MDGQVLGGGVIVAVSVLLWLVYLVPSWYERRQYDAAERNAVRLNQALRVLAETSETPDEVRLELNTRTAQAQQREAKRALAERERLAKLAAAEREHAAVEQAREELVAARSIPAARRARARRRARLLTTLVGVVAIVFLGWGAWLLATTGSQTMLWWSAGILAVCATMLVQMARVASRGAARSQVSVAEPARAAPVVQDVALPVSRQWAPRELPKPLTAASGSRAAATLDGVAAREALRQAARDEALRQRAEAVAPPTIDRARADRERARTSASAAPAPGVDFARMGYVDDAEIEAHVRDLLSRRAASA